MSRYFAGIGGNVEPLGQIEPCSSAEEVECTRIAELEDYSSSKSMGAAKGYRSCTSRLGKTIADLRQSLLHGRLDWSDFLDTREVTTSAQVALFEVE